MYELATGNPPFQNTNLEAMADNIRFEDLLMKDYFTDEFEDLIQRLTYKLPERRLGLKGASEIKNHPFFKSVNWEAIYKK